MKHLPMHLIVMDVLNKEPVTQSHSIEKLPPEGNRSEGLYLEYYANTERYITCHSCKTEKTLIYK
jgi:hypothetical protein